MLLRIHVRLFLRLGHVTSIPNENCLGRHSTIVVSRHDKHDISISKYLQLLSFHCCCHSQPDQAGTLSAMADSSNSVSPASSDLRLQRTRQATCYANTPIPQPHPSPFPSVLAVAGHPLISGLTRTHLHLENRDERATNQGVALPRDGHRGRKAHLR